METFHLYEFKEPIEIQQKGNILYSIKYFVIVKVDDKITDIRFMCAYYFYSISKYTTFFINQSNCFI